MRDLARQAVQALRSWSRTPTLTAVALATLALGIGANTALFSILQGVVLSPLPYPESDRLVGVWNTAPGLELDQDLSKRTVVEPGSYQREELVIANSDGVLLLLPHVLESIPQASKPLA